MNLRRVVTDPLIALGPKNRLVLAALNLRCRKHGATLRREGDVLLLSRGTQVMRLALGHFVYAPTMAARFDTYFTPLVPEVIGELCVLDYSRPRAHQYASTGLVFELASFPEEEEALEAYFRYYTPQPGDLVFDIGAHCGVSTHRLSQFVGP